jgi:P-type E1-E2 ATPase
LTHPVADALRSKAKELRVNVPACDDIQYRLGLGVEGQVNGYYLHVGNERFMGQNGISLDAATRDRVALDELGHSCLHIAVDGKLAGLVPYADKVRAECPSIIRRLAELGIQNTIMLTGDSDVVARAVSKRVGVSRHVAELLPADKADLVQELRRSGKVVAMVGDGINDSPALSFADVGIAMRHGAEVAHESAHVVLMEDSLQKLVQAVEISRESVDLIKQNYAIVAGMNALALALALPGGLVSPVTTALISNGSAILASLNGIRPILRYL